MKNTLRPFTGIDTWVFDLDNTLYPHHVNLWHQVDARIGEFVSAWLKVSAEEARRIQKDYYRRYGTTMRGMMTEHGVHADDFLAYVHQIDHSPLQPNPAMGAAIAKLPRAQADPDQRLDRPCRQGFAAARPGYALRGGVRHHRRRAGAEAGAADLSEIPRGFTGSIPRPRRCSRIWRATSWCRTSSA